MNDIPPLPPLTPPDCNLRDFPFMPLQVARLRASKAWLKAKREPALGFYMMNLWTAAWHEVPAASLEDDDDVLADKAMCPPDVWPTVRSGALYGWQKASDGRLYHPIVAEQALEAWAMKKAKQEEKEHEAGRKRLEREERRKLFSELKLIGVVPAFNASIKDLRELLKTSGGRPGDNGGRSRPRQGQGQGQGQGQIGDGADAPGNNKRGSRLPADWKPSDADTAFIAKERPDLELKSTADLFLDYWTSKPGKDGVRLDWAATWRNWVRNQRVLPGSAKAGEWWIGGKKGTLDKGIEFGLPAPADDDVAGWYHFQAQVWHRMGDGPWLNTDSRSYPIYKRLLEEEGM